MNRLQHRLYRAILRLHPAAFRNRFGQEMLLDCEDALSSQSFASLCFDALLSLGRQWAQSAVSAEADLGGAQSASLLAGDYVMVRDHSLTPVDWSRGLLASVVLLSLCGSLLTAGPHQPIGNGIVYAAMQTIKAAQSPPADDVQTSTRSAEQAYDHFDVASVREDKGAAHPYTNFPLGGNDAYVSTHGLLQTIDLPIAAYIQFAYKMNALQVIALNRQLPNWAASTRYDIEARVQGDPDKDDMRRMVKALLISRFHLQLRAETATGSVYNLEVRQPGKLGPSLHRHPAGDPGCSNSPAGPCGRISFSVPDPAKKVVRMSGRDVPLEQILFYATTQMGRPVLNKTGLPGTYDFTLEYAEQRYVQTPGDVDSGDTSLPSGQTFPDAVRDQLGLKLVPAKGPVTTYTLDHIEKPMPN